MADPRHPANDAWEALLSAHASLIRRFSAEEVWEDISMKEYDVLYTLSKCPEPIRPTDLNQHVLLSQPALSRLVDRLAARGLVQRVADSRDLRTVRLSLELAELIAKVAAIGLPALILPVAAPEPRPPVKPPTNPVSFATMSSL